MDGGGINDYWALIKDNSQSANEYLNITRIWKDDRGLLIGITWSICLIIAWLLYSSIRFGGLSKKISSVKNPQLRVFLIALIIVLAVISTLIVIDSYASFAVFEKLLKSI